MCDVFLTADMVAGSTVCDSNAARKSFCKAYSKPQAAENGRLGSRQGNEKITCAHRPDTHTRTHAYTHARAPSVECAGVNALTAEKLSGDETFLLRNVFTGKRT